MPHACTLAAEACAILLICLAAAHHVCHCSAACWILKHVCRVLQIVETHLRPVQLGSCDAAPSNLLDLHGCIVPRGHVLLVLSRYSTMQAEHNQGSAEGQAPRRRAARHR